LARGYPDYGSGFRAEERRRAHRLGPGFRTRFRLLGGVVSVSPAFEEAYVADKVGRLISRLEELKDPQTELLLLRVCVGTCKLNLGPGFIKAREENGWEKKRSGGERKKREWMRDEAM
jgi:hypothetical protein